MRMARILLAVEGLDDDGLVVVMKVFIWVMMIVDDSRLSGFSLGLAVYILVVSMALDFILYVRPFIFSACYFITLCPTKIPYWHILTECGIDVQPDILYIVKIL